MFDIVRQVSLLALWASLCAWAIARGRAPERIHGAMHLVAAVLTPLVQYNAALNHAELGVFVVDTVVLGLAVFVALKWHRWWTVYAAAFLLCQELTHVVRLYNLQVAQFYYASAAMFWSFASLWAMAFGTAQLEWWRFRRWRSGRQGTVPA